MPAHKIGRWSEKYEACIRCGRKKFRHHGMGLCDSCYAYEKGTKPRREREKKEKRKKRRKFVEAEKASPISSSVSGVIEALGPK